MADTQLIDVPFLDWPLSVLSTTNTPPGSPSLGNAYLVGSAPTGAWSGHANAIARWNDAGTWEYQTAVTGRTVWNNATGTFNRWNGSAWVVLNDLPNGGTVGQVLAKTSGTDYAVAWTTSQGLPTGGATGTALVKASGTDYDAAWAALHELPTGGATGEALKKNSGTNYDASWAATHEVPAGGTTGQVLAKSAGTDYALTWSDKHDVPAGGSTGQALKKTTGTDYDATWAATHEVPAGGSTGQALRKTTGTDYDATWTAVHEVPAGGTTGQVLSKNTGTDYDTTWTTPGSTAATPVRIFYFINIGTLTDATGIVGDIAIVDGANVNLYYKNATNNWTLGGPVSGGGGGGTITGITTAAGTSGLSGGGTSGTLTMAVDVHGTTLKASPTTSDELIIADAAASNALKRITIGSLPSGAPSGSAGGDLSGTYPNPTVATTSALKSATTNVNVSSATAPTSGQVLTATGGSAATWQAPASVSPSGAASGDLGGTYPSPTVTQARGLKSATTTIDVATATAPTSGQVLTATSGSAASWQTPAGGAPSGSAGGDLGGTYPNPTVTQARGLVTATGTVAVSAATAPTTGQVLTATSGTAATWQTPTGGAATDLATTGAAVNVNGAAPPSAGQALIATDATHATWQSLSGGGTITGVTAGTALTGGGTSGTVTLNVALGTTGSTAAAGNDSRLSDDRTASGLRSATTVVSVSSATAPTSGQVLTATSGTAANWQTPSGGSSGNPFLDAPSSPHADNDEFTSWPGSWTVWDATSNTVLSGSSGVDPWTSPSAGNYRFKQLGSQVLLQFPKSSDLIYIYKAFTITAAGTLIWGRISGWGPHSVNTTEHGDQSYGIGMWTSSASRPSLTNRMFAGVENTSGSAGRSLFSVINGTSATGVQNLNASVAPDIFALYVRSTPTPFGQPFWVSSAGGDTNTAPTQIAWAPGGTTYAYAGFHVLTYNAGGDVNCPIITLDFFRRVDGATAWIV